MNYYRRALEIVGAEDCDYRELVFAIAATSPGVIVRMVDSGRKKVNQSRRTAPEDANPKISTKDLQRIALEVQCRGLVATDRKLEAIKLWRTETGMSLTDSKDAVEAL